LPFRKTSAPGFNVFKAIIFYTFFLRTSPFTELMATLIPYIWEDPPCAMGFDDFSFTSIIT